MWNAFDETAGKSENLERFRKEVACLADNLCAIPLRGDEVPYIRSWQVEPAVELHMSFHHEPIDPLT